MNLERPVWPGLSGSGPRIGVFDSGHGGLTVLDALLARFPKQSFLYLGDHARAPYGDRNPETIYLHTKEHVAWLFDQGCDLVILACNTAAAVTLRRLQQTWLPLVYPDRRILGVLVPMVETVTGRLWHVPLGQTHPPQSPATIAVFATPQTVASDAYRREISLRAPETRVLQVACPGLAAALEDHVPKAHIETLVKGYVEALVPELKGDALDAAILGCTHYQLCIEAFRRALPEKTAVFQQPDVVADSMAGYFARHPELINSGVAADSHLVTTGDPQRVSREASRYLGRAVAFTGHQDWLTLPQPFEDSARPLG